MVFRGIAAIVIGERLCVLESIYTISYSRLVVSALRCQPEGAFVVRKSTSHRCCLALSVRVPELHNSVGVSHYLILRSTNGFRLKVSAQISLSPIRILFLGIQKRFCINTNARYASFGDCRTVAVSSRIRKLGSEYMATIDIET